MKNIFLLLICFLFVISCKSQTVSLTTPRYEVSEGAYFKDLDNEMDKFAGTWQYINGIDTLTIVLQKKIHVFDGEYYEDFLSGEYRYVSNGVEIVNTLSLLNDLMNVNGDNSNIQGRHLINNDMYLVCNDCNSNEKRFKLSFWDPERNYLSSSLVLRYLPQSLGEPEKMTATLIDNDSVMIPNENSPTTLRVPYGDYLMVKQ